MISRTDLINHHLSLHALDRETSSFWIAERLAISADQAPFRAEWFVLTPFPENVEEMHKWLSDNIKGTLRCFSPELVAPGRQSTKNYWWGFENQSDAMMWELRWA